MGATRGYWPLTSHGLWASDTCKNQAAVDVNGHPLRLATSGGNVHDSQMMHAFLN